MDLSNNLSNATPETAPFFESFISETHEMSTEALQAARAELNQICLEFDPYMPNHISDEIKSLIEKYNLSEMLGNPFTFTNNLLRILTATEDEIKNRS
jgi:hypothetical protein